ncbi:MAG: glycosyltransferase [Planctomycetes bacterium]|nr:glycosyltransferase [Planctomycetota bacterium]
MSSSSQQQPARTDEGAVGFAGGGSGGHISPGIAIAERIATRAPGMASVFLCSTRAIDLEMLREAGAIAEPMPASPPSLKPGRLLRFAKNYFAAKRRAAEVMRERNIRHIVSLGGFVTVPVVVAARKLGIPVTLLNLDATPGKANRFVQSRATHVFSAVAAQELKRWDGEVLGFPVRRSAVAPADPAGCRAELGLEPTRFTLLVTGASQGASSLNLFVPHFAARHKDLLTRWQILHLAGGSTADAALLRSEYTRLGVKAVVIPFLHRMGLAWGAADLALTRAGANSVAEVELNNVPAIFVPYPYHRDLHQKANAEPLVKAGAAALALDRLERDFNMQSIGVTLEHLIADGAARDAMHAALAARPKRDAADRVAELVLADLKPR